MTIIYNILQLLGSAFLVFMIAYLLADVSIRSMSKEVRLGKCIAILILIVILIR